MTITSSSTTRTESDKFQLLSERQRVIQNSTMYLGSNRRAPHTDHYIVNGVLTYTTLDIHYLLRKMNDEIGINVTDHASTPEGKHLSSMKVTNGTNYFTYEDNGGIPVILHDELNVYIPFLIFGHLGGGSKTGYDDDSARGGQNKIGASLVNILSTKFIVETSDGKNSYYQEFSNNMTEYTDPIIQPSRKKFTKITFYPDFEKINYTDQDDNIVYELQQHDLIAFETRIHELAVCVPKIVVTLNGKKIKVNSVQKYAKVLAHDFDPVCISNNNWSLCVTPSINREFSAISFINAIRTHDERSTHVVYVVDKIIAEIRSYIYKKHKIDIKPADIRNSMNIILSGKINEPKFDSQVKEFLTTPISMYDKVITLNDTFIKSLINSNVVNNLVEWAKQKSLSIKNAALKETEERALKNDPKYILKFSDATNNTRELCSLFLTEGDSANKSVISARNPKLQGSFPLKGVPLNVRGVAIDKVIKNEELFNIVTIAGLKVGMTRFSEKDGKWFNVKIENEYFIMNENDIYITCEGNVRRPSKRYIVSEVDDMTTDLMTTYKDNAKIKRSLIKGLRFDEIILTPDADLDGYKIVALHINNFSLLWPEFIKEGRLKLLKTPIIRINKGKQMFEFYTKHQFTEWQKHNSIKGFAISYIKGLSGHSASQFKKYLNNPENYYTIKPDERSDELLDMLFASNTVNQRKIWVSE